MDSGELAARACADHNAVLDLEWLIAACPDVTVGRRDPSPGLEEFWVNVTDAGEVAMWLFQGDSLGAALARARARAEREGYAP